MKTSRSFNILVS